MVGFFYARPPARRLAVLGSRIWVSTCVLLAPFPFSFFLSPALCCLEKYGISAFSFYIIDIDPPLLFYFLAPPPLSSHISIKQHFCFSDTASPLALLAANTRMRRCVVF